ncbi:MAG: tetratricopeptide repeat protein [Planctomycetes bacterium]|nr:tetratricopeptide repeat protein [Planctomycetota bacterium]
MLKRRTLFTVLCVVFAVTSMVLAEKPKESMNSGDVNNIDVAMQAFELRMAGKIDEAKEFLEKAVAANPKNATAQFELARIYFYISHETLDLDLAQKTIERAVELEPHNARFHYWSGEIAMYNGIIKMRNFWGRLAMPGQMKKAVRHFKRAVELKPDFHQARLGLMGMYDRLPWYCGGSKSKAKKQVEKLEQMDTVYGAKGRCEIRPRKSRAEKIAIWQEVVTKFPDNAAAHTGLARVYMHNGDLPAIDMEKAERHIKKTLELDPSKSRILLDLAWHYGQSKQLEKAEKAIRDYLEIESVGPASMRAYALRWLGLVQKMKGKNDESKETLKKASQLDKYLWPTRVPPPEDLFVAPSQISIRERKHSKQSNN